MEKPIKWMAVPLEDYNKMYEKANSLCTIHIEKHIRDLSWTVQTTHSEVYVPQSRTDDKMAEFRAVVKDIISERDTDVQKKLNRSIEFNETIINERNRLHLLAEVQADRINELKNKNLFQRIFKIGY